MLASQAFKLGDGRFGGSEIVQWAGSICSRTLHDVQVDHGGGDVGIAQQALDGADVRSNFQGMGGPALLR
jgi:hypothetical protein